MYRVINSRFWTDPKIRQLSTSDRYLFLYLVTNPHAHLAWYLLSPRASCSTRNRAFKNRVCGGVSIPYR